MVVVEDCRHAVEDGMVELAQADIDAEDGRENEMEEEVKHFSVVLVMRQVVEVVKRNIVVCLPL